MFDGVARNGKVTLKNTVDSLNNKGRRSGLAHLMGRVGGTGRGSPCTRMTTVKQIDTTTTVAPASGRAYHGFGFDVLGWFRGKIVCLDSSDSSEGVGGVGRMRDGPG